MLPSLPCVFPGEKCPLKVEYGSRAVAVGLPTDTLGVSSSPAEPSTQTKWGCSPRTRGPADPATRGSVFTLSLSPFPSSPPFTLRTHHIHARHASPRGNRGEKTGGKRKEKKNPPQNPFPSARTRTHTYIHRTHRSICM